MTAPPRRSSGAVAALLTGLIALLAGCGFDEGSAPADHSEKGVAVLKVEAPLRAPTWSPAEQAVFALGQDGRRLVKVDVTGGGFTPDERRPEAVASSQELDGAAGENLALERDRAPDKIYVPIPDRDEVYVSEKDDLLEVQTFEAGESPARVALGRSSGTLFALSEDGSSVTAVDLVGKEVVARIRVDGGEGANIGTSEMRGERGLWVAGSDGVGFYEGSPFERVARTSIDTGALAVDDVSPERAYVSEASPRRVVAIELDSGGELEMVAEAEVDGQVTHLAAEKGRLYAVTSNRILVLDPENLRTLETVEFDRFLDREALKRAEPSGLAVGEKNVYLTFEGEPFLMQIEKP